MHQLLLAITLLFQPHQLRIDGRLYEVTYRTLDQDPLQLGLIVRVVAYSKADALSAMDKWMRLTGSVSITPLTPLDQPGINYLFLATLPGPMTTGPTTTQD